jgi:hypothetical protein
VGDAYTQEDVGCSVNLDNGHGHTAEWHEEYLEQMSEFVNRMCEECTDVQKWLEQNPKYKPVNLI